ncbi:hypothetical protein, partial [Chryseobacterium piperi]|uniref:hypothetical protein n=1 Tax=Chryseobacterium piperi TaxID=558152 RepID=UPI000554FF22
GIVKSEVEDIYAERTFDFQMVSKSDGNLYEWELIEPHEKYIYLPKRNKSYIITFSASGLSIIYNLPGVGHLALIPVKYNGTPLFLWKFTPLENDLYNIVFKEYFGMEGAIAYWEKLPVIVSYENQDTFKWKLEYLGSGKFGIVSVSAGDDDNKYIGIVKSEVEDIYAERTFDFQMVSKSDENLYEWELVEPSDLPDDE